MDEEGAEVMEWIMKYLASNIDDIIYDGTGTTGNIFQDSLPASPDIAVMVENTGGYPVDMGNIEYKEPSIRILVRGSLDPRPAFQLSTDIINLIGYLGAVTINGKRIIKCESVQGAPINIGRDDEGRHRFSINFDLEIKE